MLLLRLRLRSPEKKSKPGVEMDSDSNAPRDAKNWHVRISRSWADLSGVIIRMAESGPLSVAYEHHPDTGCKRIHVHILFYQSTFAVNTVKDWIKKQCGSIPASDWRFKTTYKIHKGTPREKEVPITEASYPKLITYMSKGKLEPKYFNGIEKSTIDALRDEWIGHETSSPTTPQSIKESASYQTKYTVKDLEGDALNDYLVLVKDFDISSKSFMDSPGYQNELVESVRKSANEATRKGLFRGRVHVKFIREVSEYVMAQVYPDAFNFLVSRFWKFN